MLSTATSNFANSKQSKKVSKSVECLVCGRVHDSGNNIVNYKQMKLPLCSSGCEEHFKHADATGLLDPITAKIEPRGMLFQEDSNPQKDLGKWPYWISCYLLVGLIFGGIVSYQSIQKGANAWTGFLCGFLLNGLGIFLILLKPKKETRFHSKGLTKVPRTRKEILCSACEHPNHPCAKKCNKCSQTLETMAASEVEAVGLGKG